MSDKEKTQKKENAKESDEPSLEEFKQDLDTKVGEIADALDVEDPEERKELIARISRFTSSPVPPPNVLKGYDDVVEGGAKWLLDYTKNEQSYRHKMDRKELFYYSMGQIFGFIIGLIGIGGGIYLATTGAEWFGFGTFFTSLVSLVGLFIYNKKSE